VTDPYQLPGSAFPTAARFCVRLLPCCRYRGRVWLI